MMFVSSVIRKSVMEGSGMIKKSVMWFLVLTFLNFSLLPDFVIADGEFGGPSSTQVGVAVIGGLIVVGLIVFGISRLAKKTDSQSEQPQDQKENLPTSKNFQQPDEQLPAPAGRLAVLSW
jgi:hypothetical protein